MVEGQGVHDPKMGLLRPDSLPEGWPVGGISERGYSTLADAE